MAELPTMDISVSYRKSVSRNTMMASDFTSEVEIWSFRACTMHPAIITGTVRSLWQIPRSTERISSLILILLSESIVRRFIMTAGWQQHSFC